MATGERGQIREEDTGARQTDERNTWELSRTGHKQRALGCAGEASARHSHEGLRWTDRGVRGPPDLRHDCCPCSATQEDPGPLLQPCLHPPPTQELSSSKAVCEAGRPTHRSQCPGTSVCGGPRRSRRHSQPGWNLQQQETPTRPGSQARSSSSVVRHSNQGAAEQAPAPPAATTCAQAQPRHAPRQPQNHTP